MATPPTHIYHLMFLHEALTAVHSSYGYGLLVYIRVKALHTLQKFLELDLFQKQEKFWNSYSVHDMHGGGL